MYLFQGMEVAEKAGMIRQQRPTLSFEHLDVVSCCLNFFHL
jgi:hypothetical protein